MIKKKIPASACRKKKIACSTNVIESLWEKREKNILPTRLLENKILDDHKSSPAPQELNGRPLTQANKAAWIPSPHGFLNSPQISLTM